MSGLAKWGGFLLTVLAFRMVAASAPASSQPAAEKPFNGRDLAGWSWHASKAGVTVDAVWTVKEGVLHCAGKPASTGLLQFDREFKNFTLTVEYRHLSADNGGVFVCIHGEDKVWPDAIQIQGKFGSVGDLINQNTGMARMTTDPARTKTVNKDVVISRITPPPTPPPDWQPEKPLKEWNTLVITMKDGKLTATNNGILLNEASDIQPDHGKVGLQAEGAEMEFREIELTAVP